MSTVLVSNGVQKRNIAEHQLAEYQRMGYEKVEETKEPKAPAKKGK